MRSIAAVVVALVASSCGPSYEVRGPHGGPLPQVANLPAYLAGKCFALEYQGWGPNITDADSLYLPPPHWMKLGSGTRTLRELAVARVRYIGLRADPSVHAAGSNVAIDPYWNLNTQGDSIEVMWSTGMAGTYITLGVDDALALRGNAHTFLDATYIPTDSSDVTARRVDCRTVSS